MTETDTRRIDDKLDTINTRVARIETLLETEAARCPFRESIASAAATIARVGKLEDRLIRLEVRVAAIGGTAGIVTAVITSLILSAIKGTP
jgi:hypothetical protein